MLPFEKKHVISSYNLACLALNPHVTVLSAAASFPRGCHRVDLDVLVSVPNSETSLRVSELGTGTGRTLAFEP